MDNLAVGSYVTFTHPKTLDLTIQKIDNEDELDALLCFASVRLSTVSEILEYMGEETIILNKKEEHHYSNDQLAELLYSIAKSKKNKEDVILEIKEILKGI